MSRRFVDTAKSIRVPPELAKRADRLLERMVADPEAHIRMGRASVSAVLRIAIIEGLAALEAKYED